MITRCSACDRQFECPYYRLGLAQPCPHCGSVVPVNLRTVTYASIGSTGYQTNFAEFMRLLADHESREVLLRMIHTTLGLHADSGPTAQFLTAANEPISLAEVHEQIQQHPRLQYDVYQYRMNLWH